MKTFLTEKNNIPEGATGYRKQGDYIEWFSGRDGCWRLIASTVPSMEMCNTSKPVKPIPQTKEVEWVNGLPPVGSIVHGRFMHTSATDGEWQIDYISESVGVYTAVETGKQFTFATDNVILSKIETEAERLEREREESRSNIERLLEDRINFNNSTLPKTISKIIYDAGYRKD